MVDLQQLVHASVGWTYRESLQLLPKNIKKGDRIPYFYLRGDDLYVVLLEVKQKDRMYAQLEKIDDYRFCEYCNPQTWMCSLEKNICQYFGKRCVKAINAHFTDIVEEINYDIRL